jgi:ATP-binding cassette subfamily B protein
MILVLKNGEIVEQGRYAELVKLGGLFAELDAGGRFVPDARAARSAEEDAATGD